MFFALSLRDGRSICCSTGNGVDFIDWPPDVVPADVEGLVLHVEPVTTDCIEGADYAWALYE
jgi:hypothetical protein